jgi:curved DNA-binding protein CbpA
MTHYDVLNSEMEDSLESIRRRYQKLALEWHPDRVGPESHDRFIRVQKAWEVLRDAEKRREYDQWIQGLSPAKNSSM